MSVGPPSHVATDRSCQQICELRADKLVGFFTRGLRARIDVAKDVSGRVCRSDGSLTARDRGQVSLAEVRMGWPMGIPGPR